MGPFFLHSKYEELSAFKFFNVYVQTQFSSQVKVVWSNNGVNTHLIHSKTSYKQVTFYLKDLILLVPNKMGYLKEKNCHLLNVVRTFILESLMPSQFWYEAFSTVHLINYLPSPSLNTDSPFSLLDIYPLILKFHLLMYSLCSSSPTRTH